MGGGRVGDPAEVKRKPPGRRARASVSKFEREQVAEALRRDWALRNGDGRTVPNLDDAELSLSEAEYERGMVRKALEAKGRE